HGRAGPRAYTATSATPPATATAPTIRNGPTRSRSTAAASAVAITTLVSRTAATGAAAASRSAARTRRYAPKVATPAAIGAGRTCARSAGSPRVNATVPAYAIATGMTTSSR